MHENRSRKKWPRNKELTKKRKRKSTMVNSKMKWTGMNPIWCWMKKRSPSSGQNGELVHWWLLSLWPVFRHVELRWPLAMAGWHASPAWNTDLIWKRHAWGTLQCGLWMRCVVAARSLLMLIFKRGFCWCWRGDDSGVEQCAFSVS